MIFTQEEMEEIEESFYEFDEELMEEMEEDVFWTQDDEVPTHPAYLSNRRWQ